MSSLSPNLDEESHGGEVDLSTEDTTLLPSDYSEDSTKQVAAASSLVARQHPGYGPLHRGGVQAHV